MRITGGSLKGRRITVPGGIIRPAMDRMRESIFSILGELSGLSFLDLFSGSGIIALEAASRGAAYIEAVEIDPLKRKTLLQNASISPLHIHCRFMPVELYIKRAKRPFELIFCDPPFPYKYKAELLRSIFASTLVKEGTLLLLHRPKEEQYERGFNSAVLNNKLIDSRDYGRSIVDFYRHSCIKFDNNRDFIYLINEG